jgi:tetratricopeptide (TPR) repeat protein
VTIVAAAAGDHRVDVRSFEPATAFGRYEIELREIRPSDPTDRLRIATRQHAKDLAEKLHEAVSATDEKAVVERFEAAVQELVHPVSEAPPMLTLRMQEAVQLAERFAVRAQSERAVSLAQQLFQIAEKHLDNTNDIFGFALFTYAGVEIFSEDFAAADRLLEKGSPFLKPTRPRAPMLTVNGLSLLARVRIQQRRFEEAEQSASDALAVLEQSFGLRNQPAALLYGLLGGIRLAQGEYSEAEVLVRKALSLEERIDPNGRETAIESQNLGMALAGQGKYAEAEPLVAKALERLQQRLGANHPETSLAMTQLAGIRLRLGRYDEAEPMFKRGLAVIEKTGGPTNSRLLIALDDWASALRASTRDDEAAAIEERARKIRASIDTKR